MRLDDTTEEYPLVGKEVKQLFVSRMFNMMAVLSMFAILLSGCSGKEVTSVLTPIAAAFFVISTIIGFIKKKGGGPKKDSFDEFE